MSLAPRLFRDGPENVFALARRQARLFVGVAVLIGFIILGTAALIVYLYQFQVRQAERSATNLSHILSDETDRSLRLALTSATKIADHLRSGGINSVAALDAAAGGAEVQSMLKDGAASDTRLDNLFIADAEGRLINPGAGPAMSLGELHAGDYREKLHHAEVGAIYVSAPFRSTVAGTWQLSLARRLSASDGGFLGMVGGVVELDSFDVLLGKLALGAHESVSIFRDDGVIIACFPQREIEFSGSTENTDFHAQLVSPSFDGVTWDDNAPDGVNRMFAIVRSPDFPVISVAAVAMKSVIADWLRQAEALAAGVAVVILAILIGAVRLGRHNERFADAQKRAAVQTQLAVQYRRFNYAMDNIVQGLAMYDGSSRLVACNRRYAEIYGLPVASTRPGAMKDEIVAHRGHAHTGKVVEGPHAQPDGSALTISEMKDGRFIAQRKKELPDGGWVSTHEDISERCRAEAKVKEMATHDALTGLLNRFGFRQRLDLQVAGIRRPSAKFALLYLDLDQFKSVNDDRGHALGDALLKQASARIHAMARKGDTVARLGSDEFAIIHVLGNFPGNVGHLAERLIASVSEPYAIDGADVQIGASIGIALAPDHAVEANELTRMADLALHHAKSRGGHHEFFSPSMDEELRYRHDMERDLRAALALGQFELYFQPIVGTTDRKVRSFEALLRWNHPTRGRVGPNEFIPLTEEFGLIIPIGEWVLREACREAARWPADIKVGINVSAVQFKSPDLLWSVSEAITAAGIGGSRVIVEVTESVMINDADQAITTLHALRAMGIAIAMDDFGTGYSSLRYLSRFPFDKIKIDKSFIDEMGVRGDGAAIVRAATGLAKAFGMESVAEGVETEEQFLHVAMEGCSEAQGYHISRPMPAKDVFAFLGVEPREASSRPLEATGPKNAEEWRAGLPVFPAVAAVSG